MKNQSKSRRPALMGMFAAIIFVLAFTPIGYIQLPFIKATIIHIPVIIGSIMLGARYGCALGFIFGATSLISNTMAPTVSSFVFSPLVPLPVTGNGSLLSLIVCFLPRMLVGVFPALTYRWLAGLCGGKYKVAVLVISGIIGSLTNTLLVMHLIFFLFRDAYAAVRNVALDSVYNMILGIIAINGIPEAILAGMLTAAITGPLLNRKNRLSKDA